MNNLKEIRQLQILQYRLLENSTFTITWIEEIPREIIRQRWMDLLKERKN